MATAHGFLFTLKRTLSFIAIFIAAIATVLIILKQNTLNIQTNNIEAHKASDYSWQFFNTQTWQQNPQDLTRQSYIRAEVIRHQREENITYFTQPFIILTTLEHSNVIESQQAFLNPENDMTFLKDVVINRFSTIVSNNKQPQHKTLLTQKITYNNETQQVFTSQPVVIKLPQTKITGTGLQANLQDRHFNLLSNVKTIHEPN